MKDISGGCIVEHSSEQRCRGGDAMGAKFVRVSESLTEP